MGACFYTSVQTFTNFNYTDLKHFILLDITVQKWKKESSKSSPNNLICLKEFSPKMKDDIIIH